MRQQSVMMMIITLMMMMIITLMMMMMTPGCWRRMVRILTVAEIHPRCRASPTMASLLTVTEACMNGGLMQVLSINKAF